MAKLRWHDQFYTKEQLQQLNYQPPRVSDGSVDYMGIARDWDSLTEPQKQASLLWIFNTKQPYTYASTGGAAGSYVRGTGTLAGTERSEYSQHLREPVWKAEVEQRLGALDFLENERRTRYRDPQGKPIEGNPFMRASKRGGGIFGKYGDWLGQMAKMGAMTYGLGSLAAALTPAATATSTAAGAGAGVGTTGGALSTAPGMIGLEGAGAGLLSETPALAGALAPAAGGLGATAGAVGSLAGAAGLGGGTAAGGGGTIGSLLSNPLVGAALGGVTSGNLKGAISGYLGAGGEVPDWLKPILQSPIGQMILAQEGILPYTGGAPGTPGAEGTAGMTPEQQQIYALAMLNAAQTGKSYEEAIQDYENLLKATPQSQFAFTPEQTGALSTLSGLSLEQQRRTEAANRARLATQRGVPMSAEQAASTPGLTRWLTESQAAEKARLALLPLDYGMQAWQTRIGGYKPILTSRGGLAETAQSALAELMGAQGTESAWRKFMKSQTQTQPPANQTPRLTPPATAAMPNYGVTPTPLSTVASPYYSPPVVNQPQTPSFYDAEAPFGQSSLSWMNRNYDFKKRVLRSTWGV